LKILELNPNLTDESYQNVLWIYIVSITKVEKDFRDNQKFDSSLYYGLEALKLITKGKNYFDKDLISQEYLMIKNVVVSYFGLGDLENANKYKDILYSAYKDKILPKGMDEYFNFNFFKWKDLNIWGYEWFEDLPEDRFSKSFTKIVYYVYSTNSNGTDKDQLYRLHVLMFHNIDPANNIDYILTKKFMVEKREVSKTLYKYTYSKDIDYKKLQSDIKEILEGN
jgi:hypothetical protein